MPTHSWLGEISPGATDATFRAWGSAISSGLELVGLTKTSDTGQIDWASVARPAATGWAGSEIRVIPSTAGNVYLRIYYGMAYPYNNVGKLQIVTGLSPTGSGALATTHFGGYQTVSYSTPPTASGVYRNFISRWDGGFAICLGPDFSALSNRQFIVFDSTCNGSGVTTNDAYFLFMSEHSGNGQQILITRGYNSALALDAPFVSPPSRVPLYHYPILGTSQTSQARPVSLFRHLTPAIRYHRNLAYCYTNDAPAGAEMEVSMFGDTVNFISLGRWEYLNDGYTQASIASLLVRYE